LSIFTFSGPDGASSLGLGIEIDLFFGNILDVSDAERTFPRLRTSASIASYCPAGKYPKTNPQRATLHPFVSTVRKCFHGLCSAPTHRLKGGYEVYGLIDAAGVIPITVESLVSEWMHDWGNPKAGELVMEVYSRYGAMIGLGMQ
jgi:hypothetical protein